MDENLTISRHAVNISDPAVSIYGNLYRSVKGTSPPTDFRFVGGVNKYESVIFFQMGESMTSFMRRCYEEGRTESNGVSSTSRTAAV